MFYRRPSQKFSHKTVSGRLMVKADGIASGKPRINWKAATQPLR